MNFPSYIIFTIAILDHRRSINSFGSIIAPIFLLSYPIEYFYLISCIYLSLYLYRDVYVDKI